MYHLKQLIKKDISTYTKELMFS